MNLKIGDMVKRVKDGQIMKVVPDNKAVLYVDNDKLGVTDARYYLEHKGIEVVQ